LAAARGGNIRAIRGILQSRTCYEYEGWEIDEAEICADASLSFDEYQTAAYALATYPRNMVIAYPALGLAGEAGEVANKVKKIYRDDGGTLTDERRGQIKKELEDALWYIAAVATDIGVSLADIAADNIANLTGRKERDTLHGDGDNR
jgi:NTP pyrophosphatase (non-canonical NTP hydrolase)